MAVLLEGVGPMRFKLSIACVYYLGLHTSEERSSVVVKTFWAVEVWDVIVRHPRAKFLLAVGGNRRHFVLRLHHRSNLLRLEVLLDNLLGRLLGAVGGSHLEVWPVVELVFDDCQSFFPMEVVHKREG